MTPLGGTRQEGLQIILLEHAYIADDKEYVEAVKGRWTLKLARSSSLQTGRTRAN